MENPPGGVVDFKVGELVELKTFSDGFRGAWFRSKILNIIPKKNKIKLNYYDFDEKETSWEKIYDEPPYGRKTKQINKQLMLRPPYPPMYHKSDMPSAQSISEVCVVINDRWKVWDRVDWYYESVYWSARVIKVLSDVKVQIELPMPPTGQGGEYEAYCKDLRPYLDWSEREGWTLPIVRGRTSGGAHLIFPSKQGTGLEVEIAAGSPLNVSSSTRISAEGDSETQSKDVKVYYNFTEGDIKKHVGTVICEEKAQSEDVKMDGVLAEGDTQKQSSYPVICEENMQSFVEVDVEFTDRDTKKQNSDLTDAVSFQEKERSEDVKMDDEFTSGDAKKQSSDNVHTVMEEKAQCEDVKMNDDDDVVGSVDNTSSKAAVDECDIDRPTNLNIMHEYTLEAAVTDLEELANKIKWMKAILNNKDNQSTNNHSPSWKFELFPSH